MKRYNKEIKLLTSKISHMLDLSLVILFKQLPISSRKVLTTTSKVSRSLSLTLIVYQNSVTACDNQQKIEQ